MERNGDSDDTLLLSHRPAYTYYIWMANSVSPRHNIAIVRSFTIGRTQNLHQKNITASSLYTRSTWLNPRRQVDKK